MFVSIETVSSGCRQVTHTTTSTIHTHSDAGSVLGTSHFRNKKATLVCSIPHITGDPSVDCFVTKIIEVGPSVDNKGTCGNDIIEMELNEVEHKGPSPRMKTRKLKRKGYLEDNSNSSIVAVLTI